MDLKPKKIVAIGASAGGVEALKKFLPAFKKPSQLGVLLVLHLPPEGPNLIPYLFNDSCDFLLKEAESGERMEKETIYIAPSNYHLSLESTGTLTLSAEEPVNYSRPSIDVLFESVAYAAGKNAVGILLTGANHDGAKGLMQIHDHGGKTMIEDPQTAQYPTMPQSALTLFRPDLIGDLKILTSSLRSLEP